MDANRNKTAMMEIKAASVVMESPMDCPRVRQCSVGPEWFLSEDFDILHSVALQTTPSDKSGPLALVDMF